VAEIDPQVTTVAKTDFDVDTSRFTITHADARVALKPLDGFEIVVGDAFTDIAVPAHLVTREFYQEIADSLATDGFYLMNLIDHTDSLKALAASVRTLATVFPVVEVWVEAEDFTAGGRTTFVLMAGASPSTEGRMTLAPTAPGAPGASSGAFLSNVWKVLWHRSIPPSSRTTTRQPVEQRRRQIALGEGRDDDHDGLAGHARRAGRRGSPRSAPRRRKCRPARLRSSPTSRAIGEGVVVGNLVMRSSS
jgi:hypothetical protein